MENTNLEALTSVLSALKDLDDESKKRTIRAVITFLGFDNSFEGSRISEYNSTRPVISNVSNFSENRNISPKEFLRDKAPKLDIERIACLAYYLTHYRDTPFFKTLDLSTLNTEAAQPKFSNSSMVLENAVRAGLLVQATKGMKQMSAAGELFVQALPDRDAAKDALIKSRPKRRSRRTPKSNDNES